MRNKMQVFICIGVGLLALMLAVMIVSPAVAQGPGTRPGSRAPNSTAPAFTLDLYERKGNSSSGAPTEQGDLVTLPATVVCGDLVVFERPNGSLNNQSTWSDVVRFCDGVPGTGNTVRLISDGGNFPPIQQTSPSSSAPSLINPGSIVEVQTGTGNDDVDVTVYDVGNVYRLHGDAPVNEPVTDPIDQAIPSEVPEADTLLLMAGGLGGLATFLGWQWRKVRKNK